MAFRKMVSFVFLLIFSATIWADILQVNPEHPAQHTVLKPRIRISSLDQKIQAIPIDAISQFLTSSKVVGREELAQSPYVIGFAGEHIVVGSGDRIYVKSITAPKSMNYTLYREGEVYVSPESNEILGYEAKYIGNATIEKAGDPATLNVIKTSREILKGDRLMASKKSEMPLNYFPRPLEKLIKGSIISVLDGVSQIGQHDIVVIDKGRIDGLETGHTLDIYQRGKWVVDHYNKEKNVAVKLPDESVGTIMVFRSFERVSYGLVLEARNAIHVLDIVYTP